MRRKGEGFLLTTLNKGLVYYDISSKKATCLDAGTWYRTWEQNGTYISVGFPKSNASYETLDVAFARVYEYDLDTLYENAIDNILESVKALKEKEMEETETENQDELPEEAQKEEDRVIDLTPVEEINKKYLGE